MAPTERHQRISEIYRAAIELPVENQAEFLDSACGNDLSLRKDVESLLVNQSQDGGWLDRGALNIAAIALAKSQLGQWVDRQVGPYRVLSLIGSGGMGEIYRARDTRLDRDVALKVLPAMYASDPGWLRRFEREARAAGQLNHPNVLTVYDVGIHEGKPYIVAELLEGEDLRAIVRRGAVPARRAIDIARQTASGLATAHARNFVHRDLKPENLFITTDGRVKILDFGLAKETSPAFGQSVKSEAGDALNTLPGVVVGTVGYISPEQVRGEEADARSDIFVLGAILYEMLAGRRPFLGDSAAEVLHGILKEEPPDLSEVSQVPAALAGLVRHCVEKSPGRRFQTAGDLAFALEMLSTPSVHGAAFPGTIENRSAHWRSRSVLVTAVGGITLAAAWLWWPGHDSPPGPSANIPVTYSYSADGLSASSQIAPSVSPDASAFVFAASKDGKSKLYLQSIRSTRFQLLAGTEEGHHPFWKPDGSKFAFFADGQLKTYTISDGKIDVLCAVGDPQSNQGKGGTWNRTGDIVFAKTRSEPLYRISEEGGTPVKVTSIDSSRGETDHIWPHFLPDGRHFIYLARGSGTSIHVGSLDSKENTFLFDHGSNVVYSPPGFLLFVENEKLMARAFDAVSLRTTGDPFPVADRVAVSRFIRRAFFSVSENGLLIFSGEDISRVVRFDRSGNDRGAVGPDAPYHGFRLSHDGKSGAYVVFETPSDTTRASEKLWILDLEKQTRTPFNTNMDIPSVSSPVLSSSGNVAFYAARPSPLDLSIYRVNLRDEHHPERVLGEAVSFFAPWDLSHDGRFLLFMSKAITVPGAKAQLWVAEFSKEGEVIGRRRLLGTDFTEKEARFSPDGKWVAYTLDDSGKDHVYVRRFPSGEEETLISGPDGGNSPVWRRDQSEIVYLAPDRTLTSVALNLSGAGLKAKGPQQLFKVQGNSLAGEDGNYPWWDMSPDGQFFYVTVGLGPPMTVVVNWAANLKR